MMKQAYSFMLRLKMPAGVCSPELYTLLDDLSREYGHGHLRLTTRQTFQLHGVAKHNLKTVIKASWVGRLTRGLSSLLDMTSTPVLLQLIYPM